MCCGCVYYLCLSRFSPSRCFNRSLVGEAQDCQIGISYGITSFVWVAPTLLQWVELVALGGIMVSAQFLFIQSLRSGDASYVLPFLYMTLVFAAVYDYFIFSNQPDWISFLGSLTIISGAILLGTREIIQNK